MNTAAVRRLRAMLAADRAQYGLWITLEAPSITEMAVAAGLDWVVIDAEHGHLDWKDIVAHLRCTVRSNTVALVRIAELNLGLIKRVLDIGADGVVVPWIETPEQLAQAVSYAHYPPTGVRGIGAERATCWGKCFGTHVAEAEEQVLVVPIMETVQAGRRIGELCDVPGTDVFFFGPADYSSTAGFPGQWEGPGVAAELLRIKDTLRQRGKQVGVVATSVENLRERTEQGFRMVAVGLDSGLLLRSLAGSLDALGRNRPLLPSFVPEQIPSDQIPTPPLDSRPPQFAPDRVSKLTRPALVEPVELARGVSLRILVGGPQDARGLTTGLVEFQPGAELAYHVHPHGEAVTVLEGELTMEVEGRMYQLRARDNIWIPANCAHKAVNESRGLLRVHVSLDTTEPQRTLVHTPFRLQPMPDASRGVPGREHVTRLATAAWYEPNPGAKFCDFFNRDVGGSQHLSGGYGVFQPGARLPCHIHDFDESITIVDGTATCIVEGSATAVSQLQTALAPRGRCHYFVNKTNAPMSMLWVYAGGLPQRLVLAEKCCQPAT